MKKLLLFVLTAAVLAGMALYARHYAQPRRRARALQDDLHIARLAVDSCRMTLSRAEAEFRAYDDRVDSLRGRVRDYESLRPGGVPVDSFDAYMKTFGRYNDAVPEWQARADSLRGHWQRCRDLALTHNQLADSLRNLLVEIGELPDTAGGKEDGS